MKEIFERIEYFFVSKIDRIWIETDIMKIYLRKSKRVVVLNEVIECIDFASMEVEIMGQGTFTEFLKQFRKKYPKRNIFVESILTERFAKFFEKQGFKYIPNLEIYQRNMYWLAGK